MTARAVTVFKKSSKNPFFWLIFIFEKIGKPFYWFFLGIVFLLIFIGKVTKNILNKVNKIKQKIAKKINDLKINRLKKRLKLRKKFKAKSKRIKKTKKIRFIGSFFNLVNLSKWSVKKPKKVKLPSLGFRLKIRFTKKLSWFIATLLIIVSLSSFLWFYALKGLPNPEGLINRDQIVSTKIYDRNGKLLYKIYRQQNRTLVDLRDIPLSLIQATIAIEDAEFYQHHGFSSKGIFRAFLRNLEGNKVYGGSTITQQLVKNALLTPERTLKRKIKEVILAVMVEIKFSKDEILQMYFNEVPYGGAAYGIEEASQLYFNKSVKDLTISEATLLAGLPASPTTYSPFGPNPELAKERQQIVLRRMREEGFITQQEQEEIDQQKINFAPQKTDIKAPHFVMFIKEILVQEYGERMAEEGGLEVQTSLDLDIQEMTQQIVTSEIQQIKHLNISNGAALVTNPQTGEILAMVGSKDYFDIENDGNVNVTTRLRQPGSAIKPVNYAVALQNGFTPASIISDTPISYLLPNQPNYTPKNYDNRFHGNVSLRTALGSSYNVPAVKVLSAFGVERMIELGRNMGIESWDDPSRFGLSLTLGGGEVKMTELATVYATLANLGQKIELNPILKIKNYKGEILQEVIPANIKGEQVLPAGVAYLLTDILADNNARTPAFGPNSLLNIKNHTVAVKTGTTQNLRDNWTIGYTPHLLVATWVGNNDNTPMSYVASGVTGASPIWNKIMNNLLKGQVDEKFSKPENVKGVEICPLTGTLPCEGCSRRWEWFLTGTEPKTYCSSQKIKEIIEASQTTKSAN